MNNKDFISIQYKIMGAKHVKVGPINSALTPTETSVYWYMHNQYYSFVEEGKDFFTSQETIADALNMSTRTIQRILADLDDIGLIAKRTDRVGKNKTINTYAVLHYTLAEWDGKKIEGETPKTAFYDPLMIVINTVDQEMDKEYAEFISCPEQQEYLRHIAEIGQYPVSFVKTKILDWTEIDESIVPY